MSNFERIANNGKHKRNQSEMQPTPSGENINKRTIPGLNGEPIVDEYGRPIEIEYDGSTTEQNQNRREQEQQMKRQREQELEQKLKRWEQRMREREQDQPESVSVPEQEQGQQEKYNQQNETLRLRIEKLSQQNEKLRLQIEKLSQQNEKLRLQIEKRNQQNERIRLENELLHEQLEQEQGQQTQSASEQETVPTPNPEPEFTPKQDQSESVSEQEQEQEQQKLEQKQQDLEQEQEQEQEQQAETESILDLQPEHMCKEYAEAAAKFRDDEVAWVNEFITNVHKSQGGYVNAEGIKRAIEEVSRDEFLHPSRFMSSEEFNKIGTNEKKIIKASKRFRNLLLENEGDVVKYVQTKNDWEEKKRNNLEALMRMPGGRGYEAAQKTFAYFENELVKAKMDIADKRPQGILKRAWSSIGKGWRWLGNCNLSNTRLFKNSDNKFIRGVGRAASLRTAIGVSMAGAGGIGFLAGSSALGGVGTVVGTGFSVNRIMNQRQKRLLFRNFNNGVDTMLVNEKVDLKKVLEMYREITEFTGKENNKELLEDKEYQEVQKVYVSAVKHWVKQRQQKGTEFVTKNMFGELSHMDFEAQKKAEETVRQMTKKRRLWSLL